MNRKFIMKGIKIRTMNNNFIEFLKRGGNKELKEMTNQEIYYKLLEYVKEEAEKKFIKNRKYSITTLSRQGTNKKNQIFTKGKLPVLNQALKPHS